jgi:hypothetical protein
MHGSADKVKSEEHGQTESDVNGVISLPEKVWFARNWMNGANEQLKTHLNYPLPRHGDPPIIHAVLYQKYLRE